MGTNDNDHDNRSLDELRAALDAAIIAEHDAFEAIGNGRRPDLHLICGRRAYAYRAYGKALVAARDAARNEVTS